MARPLIQLTKGGTALLGSTKSLDHLRAEYQRYHGVHLPGFLEPSLLRFIQQGIRRARFYRRIHPKKIGVEFCMQENAISDLLHLIMNDSRLFCMIQQITDCGRMGCFSGRVYRMDPAQQHCLSWHNDLQSHRKVGMSVNLGDRIYRGGILQIREWKSRRIISEFANGGRGDALLFRIAPELEHRLTGLEGAVVKTAFSGWFQSSPHSPSFLKRRLFQLKNKISSKVKEG